MCFAITQADLQTLNLRLAMATVGQKQSFQISKNLHYYSGSSSPLSGHIYIPIYNYYEE